jgi:ABC-type multidrug transport system fused ATPase/permease subunit
MGKSSTMILKTLNYCINDNRIIWRIACFLILSLVCTIIEINFLLFLEEGNLIQQIFGEKSITFNPAGLVGRLILVLCTLPVRIILTKSALDISSIATVSIVESGLRLSNTFNLTLVSSSRKEVHHLFSSEALLFQEGVVYPLLMITSSSVSVIGLSIGFLIGENWFSSLTLLIVLVLLFFLSYKILSPINRRLAFESGIFKERLTVESVAYLDNLEYLEATGRRFVFARGFLKILSSYFENSTGGIFIGTIPKYFFEFFTYAIILLIIGTGHLLGSKIFFLADLIIVSAFFLSRVYGSLSILIVNALSLKANLSKTSRLCEYITCLHEYKDIKSSFVDFRSRRVPELSMPSLSDSFISSRNVRMIYSNRNSITLGSFDIRLKNWTGVSGDSGVGKSTLVNLILGLIPPGTGRFTLETGADTIHTFSEEYSSLSLYAYVPQTPFFMCRTVKSILFDNSPEEMNKVIRSAGLSSVVARYGLDGDLGENCCNLSGGEKQRLSIGRALSSPSYYLILDEPTASLDQVLSREILLSIKKDFPCLGVLLISHKSEDLELCDHILYKRKAEEPFIYL